MKRPIEALPVLIKLSAFVFGAPLILLGLYLIVDDLAQMIRLHGIAAASLSGLAVGPMFILLGASFLWPVVLPYAPHH